MYRFIRTSTDEICVKPVQYNHSNVVKKRAERAVFCPCFDKVLLEPSPMDTFLFTWQNSALSALFIFPHNTHLRFPPLLPPSYKIL